MANNHRLKNFEILGLVLFGIATALIVLVAPLSNPATESAAISSSSHHVKSSPIYGISSTQTAGSSVSNIDTNIAVRSSSSNDKVILR